LVDDEESVTVDALSFQALIPEESEWPTLQTASQKYACSPNPNCPVDYGCDTLKSWGWKNALVEENN
jgi:hypothetical protein